MEFNIDILTTEQKKLYYHYISYIDKRGIVRSDMSPCWRWTRSITSTGYGQVCHNNIRWNTHRLSYYIHNGCVEIEKGKHICHRCDNKECSNPEHLYLGTAKENAKDVWDRGIKLRKEPKLKGMPTGIKTAGCFTSEATSGEHNTKAKLSWEQVRAIRQKHSEGLKYGELKKMAEEYHISYNAIQKIIANDTWKE